MKRIFTIAIPVALMSAIFASGPSAQAQGMPGKTDSGRVSGPGYEVTQEMQRYREMANVMRDMSQQMSKLQADMAKGGMSAEQQSHMQQKLREMSELMTQMAGLGDRPSMNDPESRKQIGEMRKQMDRMMRSRP